MSGEAFLFLFGIVMAALLLFLMVFFVSLAFYSVAKVPDFSYSRCVGHHVL